MGNTCNYECSYCPKGLHQGDKPWPRFAEIRRFLERVCEHYLSGDRRLYADFTGGEVTLYRELPELVSFLRERGVGVSLLSNGSRTLDWWSSMAPQLDHVSLSYHAEHADAGHFRAVAGLLSKAVSLHVNVIMIPARFEECRSMAEWVSRDLEAVTVSAQALFENMQGRRWDYDPAQLEYLRHPNLTVPLKVPRKSHRGRMRLHDENGGFELLGAAELIAQGRNRFRGWTCWAGLEQLVVDFDGSVMRGWCREGGALGNVLDPESVRFPEEPILCSRGHCHCVLDAMTRKTAPHSQP